MSLREFVRESNEMNRYQTDTLDLRLMDCMDLMREFPDKHFDLAIVDPPYFEDYAKKNYTGANISTSGVARQTKAINHWEIPDDVYFNELRRVSKNQIIWGCNYYAKHIPDFGRIVWDKQNDSSTFSKAEIASKSHSLGVDMFRFMWNGMLQGDMANKEKRIHPTQKPVALYRWILANYAKEGMRILDTHLGSMSSAIAAHYGGVHLTGCELDHDYFAAGIARVKKETAQMTLF
jgi:site-specific DNA-methyltransferase (adenine-specific)